ncbi:unnamed protein product [Closterium sp. NIES-65]|nr:unnamed protein product [Closterium sp. NIES-65]
MESSAARSARNCTIGPPGSLWPTPVSLLAPGGPNPAPGLLGAGWARSFFFDLVRAASEAAPFAGSALSPSAWPGSRLFVATAAAGVPSHTAKAVTTTSAPPAAAASVDAPTGRGGAGSSACDSAAPDPEPGQKPSAGGKANAAAAKGEDEPPPAATVASAASHASPAISANSVAAGTISIALRAAAPTGIPPVAASPAAAVSASTLAAGSWVSAPASSSASSAAADSAAGFSGCLSQSPCPVLHVYQARLWLEDAPPPPMALQEQEKATAAAMQMLRMLPLIGLVPGSPSSALGPGPASLRRLALAALQAPRDIVSAAASVLRWMDGRLSWILAE